MHTKPDVTKEDIAKEFISDAQEDLEVLELIRREDFAQAKNACMLAARYSEKLIKAKLILSGYR